MAYTSSSLEFFDENLHLLGFTDENIVGQSLRELLDNSVDSFKQGNRADGIPAAINVQLVVGASVTPVCQGQWWTCNCSGSHSESTPTEGDAASLGAVFSLEASSSQGNAACNPAVTPTRQPHNSSYVDRGPGSLDSMQKLHPSSSLEPTYAHAPTTHPPATISPRAEGARGAYVAGNGSGHDSKASGMCRDADRVLQLARWRVQRALARLPAHQEPSGASQSLHCTSHPLTSTTTTSAPFSVDQWSSSSQPSLRVVRVSVEDTGSGILGDLPHALFALFTSSKRASSTAGMFGVGLKGVLLAAARGAPWVPEPPVVTTARHGPREAARTSTDATPPLPQQSQLQIGQGSGNRNGALAAPATAPGARVDIGAPVPTSARVPVQMVRTSVARVGDALVPIEWRTTASATDSAAVSATASSPVVCLYEQRVRAMHRTAFHALSARSIGEDDAASESGLWRPGFQRGDVRTYGIGAVPARDSWSRVDGVGGERDNTSELVDTDDNNTTTSTTTTAATATTITAATATSSPSLSAAPPLLCALLPAPKHTFTGTAVAAPLLSPTGPAQLHTWRTQGWFLAVWAFGTRWCPRGGECMDTEQHPLPAEKLPSTRAVWALPYSPAYLRNACAHVASAVANKATDNDNGCSSPSDTSASLVGTAHDSSAAAGTDGTVAVCEDSSCKVSTSPNAHGGAGAHSGYDDGHRPVCGCGHSRGYRCVAVERGLGVVAASATSASFRLLMEPDMAHTSHKARAYATENTQNTHPNTSAGHVDCASAAKRLDTRSHSENGRSSVSSQKSLPPRMRAQPQLLCEARVPPLSYDLPLSQPLTTSAAAAVATTMSAVANLFSTPTAASKAPTPDLSGYTLPLQLPSHLVEQHKPHIHAPLPPPAPACHALAPRRLSPAVVALARPVPGTARPRALLGPVCLAWGLCGETGSDADTCGQVGATVQPYSDCGGGDGVDAEVMSGANMSTRVTEVKAADTSKPVMPAAARPRAGAMATECDKASTLVDTPPVLLPLGPFASGLALLLGSARTHATHARARGHGRAHHALPASAPVSPIRIDAFLAEGRAYSAALQSHQRQWAQWRVTRGTITQEQPLQQQLAPLQTQTHMLSQPLVAPGVASLSSSPHYSPADTSPPTLTSGLVGDAEPPALECVDGDTNREMNDHNPGISEIYGEMGDKANLRVLSSSTSTSASTSTASSPPVLPFHPPPPPLPAPPSPQALPLMWAAWRRARGPHSVGVTVTLLLQREADDEFDNETEVETRVSTEMESFEETCEPRCGQEEMIAGERTGDVVMSDATAALAAPFASAGSAQPPSTTAGTSAASPATPLLRFPRALPLRVFRCVNGGLPLPTAASCAVLRACTGSAWGHVGLRRGWGISEDAYSGSCSASGNGGDGGDSDLCELGVGVEGFSWVEAERDEDWQESGSKRRRHGRWVSADEERGSDDEGGRVRDGMRGGDLVVMVGDDAPDEDDNQADVHTSTAFPTFSPGSVSHMHAILGATADARRGTHVAHVAAGLAGADAAVLEGVFAGARAATGRGGVGGDHGVARSTLEAASPAGTVGMESATGRRAHQLASQGACSDSAFEQAATAAQLSTSAAISTSTCVPDSTAPSSTHASSTHFPETTSTALDMPSRPVVRVRSAALVIDLSTASPRHLFSSLTKQALVLDASTHAAVRACVHDVLREAAGMCERRSRRIDRRRQVARERNGLSGVIGYCLGSILRGGGAFAQGAVTALVAREMRDMEAGEKRRQKTSEKEKNGGEGAAVSGRVRVGTAVANEAADTGTDVDTEGIVGLVDENGAEGREVTVAASSAASACGVVGDNGCGGDTMDKGDSQLAAVDDAVVAARVSAVMDRDVGAYISEKTTVLLRQLIGSAEDEEEEEVDALDCDWCIDCAEQRRGVHEEHKRESKALAEQEKMRRARERAEKRRVRAVEREMEAKEKETRKREREALRKAKEAERKARELEKRRKKSAKGNTIVQKAEDGVVKEDGDAAACGEVVGAGRKEVKQEAGVGLGRHRRVKLERREDGDVDGEAWGAWHGRVESAVDDKDEDDDGSDEGAGAEDDKSRGYLDTPAGTRKVHAQVRGHANSKEGTRMSAVKREVSPIVMFVDLSHTDDSHSDNTDDDNNENNEDDKSDNDTSGSEASEADDADGTASNLDGGKTVVEAIGGVIRDGPVCVVDVDVVKVDLVRNNLNTRTNTLPHTLPPVLTHTRTASQSSSLDVDHNRSQPRVASVSGRNVAAAATCVRESVAVEVQVVDLSASEADDSDSSCDSDGDGGCVGNTHNAAPDSALTAGVTSMAASVGAADVAASAGVPRAPAVLAVISLTDSEDDDSSCSAGESASADDAEETDGEVEDIGREMCAKETADAFTTRCAAGDAPQCDSSEVSFRPVAAFSHATATAPHASVSHAHPATGPIGGASAPVPAAAASQPATPIPAAWPAPADDLVTNATGASVPARVTDISAVAPAMATTATSAVAAHVGALSVPSSLGMSQAQWEALPRRERLMLLKRYGGE